MRGGSLCDVVDLCGGQLLESDGKVVMSCILQGLRAMHEGGYAHLDIKPANIGLAEEGDLNSVALLDYGSAEPVGARAETRELHAHEGAAAVNPPVAMSEHRPCNNAVCKQSTRLTSSVPHRHHADTTSVKLFRRLDGRARSIR